MNTHKQLTIVETTLGRLTLVATDAALMGVYFADHNPAPNLASCTRVDSTPMLDSARDELRAYLAGERSTFTVPLAFEGTALQREVWNALRTIPRGETHTYGELAQRLGRPRSARAVGHAVARNPLSIVVPCHRVIGASGALTGFAGGLWRKAALLALEGVVAPQRSHVPSAARQRSHVPSDGCQP